MAVIERSNARGIFTPSLGEGKSLTVVALDLSRGGLV